MANTPVANRKLFRNNFQRFQQGGMVEPMQPPMPMSQMPPQAPLMAPDAMMGDPNSAAMVEGAIADETATQVTNVQQDIDNAQNIDQLLKSFGTEETSEETVRDDLAGIVGPEDAMNTPDSVLALVQPMLSMLDMDDEVATGGLGDLLPEPDVDDSLAAPTMPMLAEDFNPVDSFADGTPEEGLDLSKYALATGELGMQPIPPAFRMMEVDPLMTTLTQLRERMKPMLDADLAKIPTVEQTVQKYEDALKKSGLLIQPRSVTEIAEQYKKGVGPTPYDASIAKMFTGAGKAIMESKEPNFFAALMAGADKLAEGAAAIELSKASAAAKRGEYAVAQAAKEQLEAQKQKADVLKQGFTEAAKLKTSSFSDYNEAVRELLPTALELSKSETEAFNKAIGVAYDATQALLNKPTVNYAWKDKDGTQHVTAGRAFPDGVVRVIDNATGKWIPLPKGGFLYNDATKNKVGFDPKNVGDEQTVLVPGVNKNNPVSVATGMQEVKGFNYAGQTWIYDPRPTLPNVNFIDETETPDVSPTVMNNNFNKPVVAKTLYGNNYVTGQTLADSVDIEQTGPLNIIRINKKIGNNTIGQIASVVLPGGSPVFTGTSKWIAKPMQTDENGVTSGNYLIHPENDKRQIDLTYTDMSEEERKDVLRVIRNNGNSLSTGQNLLEKVYAVSGIGSDITRFISGKVNPLLGNSAFIRENLKLGGYTGKQIAEFRTELATWGRKFLRNVMISPRFAVTEQLLIGENEVPIDKKIIQQFIDDPFENMAIMSALLRQSQNDLNRARAEVLGEENYYVTPRVPSGTTGDPFEFAGFGHTEFLSDAYQVDPKNGLKNTWISFGQREDYEDFLRTNFRKPQGQPLTDKEIEGMINQTKRQGFFGDDRPYILPAESVVPRLIIN